MKVLLHGKPFLFPFPWLTLIPYSVLKSELISSCKPSLVFPPTLLWGTFPVLPSHDAGLFVCLSSQPWIIKRQRLNSSNPQHLAWAWSDGSSGHAFEQMTNNISWTGQSCDSRERGASQPSELSHPLKARKDILKGFVTPALGHQKAEARMILFFWVKCKKQGRYWGERWQWGEGWKKKERNVKKASPSAKCVPNIWMVGYYVADIPSVGMFSPRKKTLLGLLIWGSGRSRYRNSNC